MCGELEIQFSNQHLNFWPRHWTGSNLGKSISTHWGCPMGWVPIVSVSSQAASPACSAKLLHHFLSLQSERFPEG